jgi:hypothetical protein
MDGIKRNLGGTSRVKHPSTASHKTTQKSATLNRKFVKKPTAPTPKVVAHKSTAKVLTRAEKEKEAYERRLELAAKLNRESFSKIREGKKVEQPKGYVGVKLAKKPEPKVLTARELKERAIKRALAQMEKGDVEQATVVAVEEITTINRKRRFWQSKKFVVAVSMAVASVLLLGYFVHLNLPDISIRIAAAQSGVDASYPSHIPVGFRLSEVSSDKNGKIEMNFHRDNQTFTLIQEKSSWDSQALYQNYVVKNFGDNPVLMKEQGLTIYSHNSDAAWVSGGILYKIVSSSDNLLDRRMILDIALSL